MASCLPSLSKFGKKPTAVWAVPVSVEVKRSAPVSKLFAMIPRRYQCSSALLPAAE